MEGLVEKVRREFALSVDSALMRDNDVFSLSFEYLHFAYQHDQVEALGEILAGELAGEDSELLGQIALASTYSSGKKLHGIEKVIGRSLAGLLKSLTPGQRSCVLDCARIMEERWPPEESVLPWLESIV